jgi:superfamily II DNA or RNA helicase
MTAAPSLLRPGDIVRIRDERWRIVSHAPHGDAAVVEAAGCEAANRASRAHFLLPFEPIDRLPAFSAPRLVRPARWRRVARRVLAEATPSWTSLRAAAQGDLTFIPFQLEPALALIRGAACRFLIADGVGLGKTVQAGLMIAEVLARRSEARALVISPAALREQWRHELSTRFHLDAAVLDAAGVARIAADQPSAINPWSLSRLVITSIDYIKRPEVMRSIEALTWDFVAFDEAHNLAGRSDRAAAAQALGRRARVLALLTATPHSGDDNAFDRLCGIGDIGGAYPLLMFRRTRADAGIASRRRSTLLRVRPTAAEAAMHAALMTYATRAWAESTGDAAPGARLAMTVLTRRACSSAGSLAHSVERRLALLQQAPCDAAQMQLPFADVAADDEEPGAWLGSQGLRDPVEEHALLRQILELARAAATGESKLACVRRLMGRIAEPAIIFTEYRDTLERLAGALTRIDAVQLHGGLTSRERMDALSRFTAGGARLLLATDAASEGLNLHHRCRLVINLELPWTPVRLDQRAGRVDRIGQPRTVHAVRLVAADTCEESIVARLARRVERIRDALGAMPDERRVAESVFDASPIPPVTEPRPPSTAGIIRVDLRAEAAGEAQRLARVQRWLGVTSDHQETRPAITRLRPRRRGLPHQCLWAFRAAMASGSDEIVWETILAARASLARTPEPGAPIIRAVLGSETVRQHVSGDLEPRQVEMLRETLRAPLALWARREVDLMSVIRDDHARMSAGLRQGGLFDGRNARRGALPLPGQARGAACVA